MQVAIEEYDEHLTEVKKWDLSLFCHLSLISGWSKQIYSAR